jgi:hypothetical protein
MDGLGPGQAECRDAALRTRSVLIDLLDVDSWVEGIEYLLADHGIDGKPWPHHRAEDRVWI